MNKKDKISASVFWLLSIICMGVIYWFSDRDAVTSAGQSSFFAVLLAKLIGNVDTASFLIRKAAHCLEYTGLSLLLCAALYYTKNIKTAYFGILIASLYAVTDEIHQRFIPGRSCELRDWIIDTFGALLGAALFTFIYYIGKKIISVSKSKDNAFNYKIKSERTD